MKANIKKNIKYILLIIFGLFMGWLLFHPRENAVQDQIRETEIATIWTCAMHPQIRMDEPGKCPICGMDLIPLGQAGGADIDPAAIMLTNEAAELANVQTTLVTRQKPVKRLRLYGKIQADERLLQSQVAHISGRIERLLVNFTGETVNKGQALAQIYSPELVTAQQELLEAAEIKDLQPEIYQAARERLSLWKIPESQINAIESSGSIQSTVEVVSNTSGIVISKNVSNGDYIGQGSILFEIADLSKVWVMFDAYESDLSFLNRGDKLEFTVQAIPGKVFAGNIAFIDPVLDPVTRVARVRVETVNQSARLKPEMFVTGTVETGLTGLTNEIVIPKSAVLWTGPRSVVYVKEPVSKEPVFMMREIDLGPELGEGFVVSGGLKEGEEIVTSGAFSVDAAAQLEGKPSMMNPSGGVASTGHDHDTGMTDNEGATIASTKSATAANNINENDQTNVPMDFIMQLNNVYEQYLNLKNSLVKSDAGAAEKAAGGVQQALSSVDMSLLKGESHEKWMVLLEKLNSSAKAVSSSGDIETQRKAFAALSESLYNSIKMFGLVNKTLFYQFCPMADKNKVAYWLSDISEIRNPYFGDAMLTCGETKETLKF